MYLAKTIYNDYLSKDDTTIYRSTAKRFYTKKELYSYAYKIFKLHKNEIIPEKIIDDENDKRFIKAFRDVSDLLHKHPESYVLDYDDYRGVIHLQLSYELVSELRKIENYKLIIEGYTYDLPNDEMYFYYSDEAIKTI